MGFVTELRRRNVFRVAIAYVIVAWLVLQVGDTLAPALHLGEWVNSLLAFFLILGFPLAMFFAWAFEMTPEGIRKEKDVDRSTSIAQQTGKKVDRLIIGVLVVAVAYFAFDKFVLDPSRDAELVQAAAESSEEVEEIVGHNSIAVLPFADLSPEGDQEYFSDGIAEEILNVLVRVEDLSVASRTSSFGFKGQEALGIPTIAEKLKVRHVLEGSVRKAGDTVRITAQLIDASTDQHLWSDTYDRQLTAESIFAIQDEIAQAIVNELGILIDERTVEADTQNLNAYELYLRAHKMFIERSDILGAIDLFEQAVAADPEFARAVAGLSAAYVIAPSWGFVERDFFTLASDAAEKAIVLNPDLALAHAVMGYVAKDLDPPALEDALVSYDRALELNPKETTAWLWRGIFNNNVGFFDRAKRDLERCLVLDPAYQNCRRHLARSFLYNGEIDESLRIIEEAILMGFPRMNPMFLRVYAARGNHTLVLMALSAGYQQRGFGALVEYEYRALTDPDFDFAELRNEIETVYEATVGDELDWGPEDFLDPLSFGVYEAVDQRLTWQAWWQPYPTDFHSSPYRKRLIRQAGLPDYWRKHGFPPQCRPAGEDDFECDVPVPSAEKKRMPVGAPR